MPGALFAQNGAYVITTVLGSCIAVCLWDRMRKEGGMNHYKLPLWNGDGLPSPKYGNIAIAKLIE
ncbi:MAG: chemotaxis protein CheD, partial [Magnetococcales bacterium]|nr:chemotaxis protein CheD [Magnetococcales bacterium]